MNWGRELEGGDELGRGGRRWMVMIGAEPVRGRDGGRRSAAAAAEEMNWGGRRWMLMMGAEPARGRNGGRRSEDLARLVCGDDGENEVNNQSEIRNRRSSNCLSAELAEVAANRHPSGVAVAVFPHVPHGRRHRTRHHQQHRHGLPQFSPKLNSISSIIQIHETNFTRSCRKT